MQQRNSPVPMLVASVLIAAVLCTILVKGGWQIWLPILPALAVTAYLVGGVRR